MMHINIFNQIGYYCNFYTQQMLFIKPQNNNKKNTQEGLEV